ncbi:MAG: DsbA family oxidoreductase [Actinomycetales bacterium]|nr:DsbA family oxidoreductase [Actinomycetales bacterium]
MTDPVKVDIWSDIACPWCFIGKRKFEAGVAASGVPVEVEYHSFELAPDTPVDFEGSEREYLASRGFPAERIPEMIDRVTGIAAGVGLHYDYDALRHTNTVKAHQLLHLAKERGRQIELMERLLAAYFEQGRHLGHDEELADLAAEVGLDREEALAVLRENRYLDAVRDDQAHARQLGITGVPFFVFEGRYGVSGAQESATFADVLAQVVQQREAVPSGEGAA